VPIAIGGEMAHLANEELPIRMIAGFAEVAERK
jgi:hypothetical protein